MDRAARRAWSAPAVTCFSLTADELAGIDQAADSAAELLRIVAARSGRRL